MVDLASIAASASLQVLFEKVLNVLWTFTGTEYRLLQGGNDQAVNQDLNKLKDTLITFRKMVRDDELNIFKNKEARDWYHSLRCAVNEADRILGDALDSADSDDRHRRVCHPFPIPTFFEFSVSNGNKLSERIKPLLQKFDILETQKHQLNFDKIDLTLDRATMSMSSEVVIGRNDESEKIVSFLLSDADTQSSGPRVYAITGLGGIGKTTLARLIHNDKRVVEHFETISWVWVSQNFDVKKVMEDIIETVPGETPKFEALETTQNHLKKLLSGKKFLLVLDDMWNEDEGKWDKLKSPLSFGAIGSCILLTTRGSGVASTARANNRHMISVLTEDQCWQVFKESAFLEGNEEKGLLGVIGKQIAKKCGGLPLAAKSLGGTLRLTREVPEWESVRDSCIWELPQSCDIVPALMLSFDNLEPHSRECFTFCCVFPKGYRMIKEELIHLWMANDLVPFHPRLELEDMGNKIYNDLVLNSFFQLGYYAVTMHDLMHDLGLIFRPECFSLEGPVVPKIPPQCLHLFVQLSLVPLKTNILETLSNSHSFLRTCILRCYDEEEIIFKNLDCLRALDLRMTKMKDLPISIGNVRDLKYLNLYRNCYLTNLPNSISTLTKLQTLKLGGCRRLAQLPEGITQLVSLRFLDLERCNELTHLPDGITQLVNLRHVVLGECFSLTHLPDGIGRLNNLRHLDVSKCCKLTQLPDDITGLVNLRHLELSYCWGLMKLPDEIGRLNNLRHLDLSHGKLTHLPDGIARLNNLRHLDLSGCEELTHFPDGITGLANLERLDIRSCPKLTKLPNGMDQMVNLQTLLLDFFVVGKESKQRITELQQLNRLVGKLEIRGLENVRDAMEATEAILKEKKNLSSLSLVWGDLQGSNNSSDEAEDVLEALQPPQSLNEELIIRGYGGSVFPRWMKLLENLVCIELRDCIKCEHLPPLGQLIHLRFLGITGMKSLKCINTQFYGSQSSSSSSNNSSSEGCIIFPSLEALEINDMPLLEEWQDIEMKDNQQIKPCPRLEQLELYKCPKLTSLPSEILHSVQQLEIHGCDKVIVRSLHCLTSLGLDGEGTNSVTSFPGGSLRNLDALEHVRIECYDEMTFLPYELSNLISLKRLEILSCPALQSVHVIRILRNLSNLESLEVCKCEQLELSSTDFQSLISLQELSVTDLPKLTSFPCLQHTSKLEKLRIKACKNLLRLWPHGMQTLTALWRLTFDNCEQLELSSTDFQHLIKLRRIELQGLPKLTSLPELQHLHSLDMLSISNCKNLKILPHWLQNVTSLDSLWIKGCDRDLESRCAKDTGEYWPFIKHIPYVCIGKSVVQDL